MKLLFWNLGRKENSRYVNALLKEKKIDIAIFAEHENLTYSLIKDYMYIDGLGTKGKIVSFINPTLNFTVKRPQDRYVIYSCQYNYKSVILCGVHLPDRRNNDCWVRANLIRQILNDLKDEEDNSENTIIIGDFNCNPYDPEMLCRDLFNAVLFKNCLRNARSATDLYNNKRYKRFYNPMLLKLTEERQEYGSYYLNSGSCPPRWNTLDQVIVRPALMDQLVAVEYVQKIGETNLLTKMGIVNEKISDHLPLYVEVNL